MENDFSTGQGTKWGIDAQPFNNKVSDITPFDALFTSAFYFGTKFLYSSA